MEQVSGGLQGGSRRTKGGSINVGDIHRVRNMPRPHTKPVASVYRTTSRPSNYMWPEFSFPPVWRKTRTLHVYEQIFIRQDSVTLDEDVLWSNDEPERNTSERKSKRCCGVSSTTLQAVM